MKKVFVKFLSVLFVLSAAVTPAQADHDGHHHHDSGHWLKVISLDIFTDLTFFTTWSRPRDGCGPSGTEICIKGISPEELADFQASYLAGETAVMSPDLQEAIAKARVEYGLSEDMSDIDVINHLLGETPQ